MSIADQMVRERKPNKNLLIWRPDGASAGEEITNIPSDRRYTLLVAGYAGAGAITVEGEVGFDTNEWTSLLLLPVTGDVSVEFTAARRTRVTWASGVTAPTVIEIRPTRYHHT